MPLLSGRIGAHARQLGWSFGCLGMLLVSAAACATHQSPVFESARDNRVVVVRVDNASWELVRVYLVRGSTRYVLGDVDAASVVPLRLPARLLGTGTVELLAEPRSTLGTARSTGDIQLYPGDTVEWSIDNHRAIYALRRG